MKKDNNMNNPKISVVTVVYNDVDHIESTIKSVISQTYPHIEYIVIDGGSTDGTVDIIKKYKNSIAYFISEKDNGIYDAMNKAINAANGEWISFINSWDSFYSNDVIEKIFSNRFKNGVDVIYGDVCLITVDGNLIKTFGKLKPDMVPFNLCHQSTFTKTRLLKKYKYDTSYRIAADMDFFNKINKNENSIFEYIPIIIANYECGHGTSANNLWKKYSEYRRLKDVKLSSISGIKHYIKDIIKYLYYSLPFGLSDYLVKKRMKKLYKPNNGQKA